MRGGIYLILCSYRRAGWSSLVPSFQKIFCSKLMAGLRCIDNFTTTCLEEEHRAYFNTLYTGTTQVFE